MRKVIICVLFLTAILTQESKSQWLRSSGAGGAINCFFDAGSNLYAGTNGLLTSTDHGLTWQSILDYGLSGNSLVVTAIAPLGSTIFAALAGNDLHFGGMGHGIMRSMDAGFNWSAANAGLHGDTNVCFLATLGSDVFATTGLGVYRSSDSGRKWYLVNNGLIIEPYPKSIRLPLKASDDTLFVGTYHGLYLSTDHGASWTATGDSPGYVNFFDIDGSNIVTISAAAGMFLSTNRGRQWARLNDTLPSGDVISDDYYYDMSSLFFYDHALFASINGSQGTSAVVVSTDLGGHWKVLDSSNIGDPDRVNALVASGPNIVLGSTFGLWYQPLSEIGLSAVVNSARTFSLSISPNPTQGSIVIQNQTQGSVQISITSPLGTNVIQIPATPDQYIPIDLTHHPAGAYIARITTPYGVVVRKIIKE